MLKFQDFWGMPHLPDIFYAPKVNLVGIWFCLCSSVRPYIRSSEPKSCPEHICLIV